MIIRLFLAVVMAALASVTVMAQEGGFAEALRGTPAAPSESSSAASVVTQVPTTAPDSSEGPVQVFEPEVCRYVPGQPTNQACIDLMAQYPEPDVTPIQQDGYTLSAYSFWRVGPQPVNAYESPGGALTRVIPQGFNFVNVVNQTDGWIQSENGEWISMNDAYYVEPSRFTGVLLPEGWNQPFGWILDTTGIWASTEPGAPGSSESGLVPLHYERYNIFAEAVDDEGWTWYMVGPNQWVKQIYMTVIKPIARPETISAERWVAIDLFEQSLVAYEGERPVFASLISTGLPGTETNEGTFEVWARLARDAMSGATGAPNAYALQSVPWVLYFDNSISLHGTYWHDLFGYRRSRGCVNLSISDARWVFEWMAATPSADGADVFNQVHVHSSGEYRSS